MKIEENINPYASNFVPVQFRRLASKVNKKNFMDYFEYLGKTEENPRLKQKEFVYYKGKVIDFYI